MSKPVRRIVSTSFWEDSNVIDNYTVEDRYFMLYLLTNPHTTQAGIYSLPYRLAAFETGYSIETTKSLFERFQNVKKVLLYSKKTQEVAVLNSLKYSIVKGGKPVIDCIQADLNRVQSDELLFATYYHLKDWWSKSDRSVDHDVMKVFTNELKKRKEPKENKLINDIENDNDNDNDNDSIVAYDSYDDSYHDSSKSQPKANSKQSIPYEEIIDYLNQKTGRSFKATSSANRKYIRARWKDGFGLDDFKRAIDNQAFQWQGTKWWPYMRPSTLFNSKNFENYVNANDESAIQKKSKQIKEVLDYLSKKTNKHFNEQAAINREPIIALLDSGYTVDNFKTVIDNKYKDWHGVQFKSGQLGDNYLVPNTLFNEKKFERYLNQTQEASNGGFDKSLFTDTTDFDDSSLPF